jgi:ubiquinone/menaquinone biosynthesis C-methylase UbiE
MGHSLGSMGDFVTVRETLKRILRKPANWITASSTGLTYRLEKAFNSPSLTARFFALEENQDVFIHPLTPPAPAGAGLPMPPKDLWEYYGQTEEEYLKMGVYDVRVMLDLLGKTGFQMGPGMSVLDFGCSAGRMIRQFEKYARECDIWGIDVSARNVLWCQDHLSPPFKFITTTTFPHLPFEDNQFDLIYCSSVFTHITGLPEMWMMELRRIMKPGGRMYATVHDKHTLEVLLGAKYPREQHCPFMIRKFVPQSALERNDFAIMTIMGDAKRAQVFYDMEWLKRHWKPYMDVLSVLEEAQGHQTAMVLQKPVRRQVGAGIK